MDALRVATLQIFGVFQQPAKAAWFALPLAILLVAGTSWYLMIKPEWDAQALFHRASSLAVGRASAEDVLSLAKAERGREYGFESCLAGADSCTGTIYVANTWLSRLKLAPVTAFGARFGITNNMLTNREFVMDIYGMYGKGTYGEASVNERRPAPGRPTFDVRGWSSGVVVNLTTGAATDLKNLAYSFNFHCMARFGGCTNYEEILPILKRKDLVGANPWMTSSER